MTSLDKVLDEAMDLPLEQQEMLIQILQRRMIERRRDEIATDAAATLAEFRAGKLKTQTANEAIASLREFLQHEE
jgi:transcriptional regulator with AAA-type ATPase domain